MTVKNDVSCIVGCTMNLYEHQSSYNPNMPLRGFIYFATLYNTYTDQRKLNLFSSTLQKIPTPQFVVFYNGLKNEPDRQILRLSDAFQTKGGCLECEAVMLNINYGQNLKLMEKCRRLEEYAIFIATVREYAADKKRSLGEAITLAIDACIEKGILLDILTAERTEVFMYILESFDKELYERDLKADAYEDGVRAGIREGENNKLVSQIKIKLEKGKNVEQIADELEESVENIQNLVLQLEGTKE
jgi:predicted transposase YdaD